MLRLYTDHPHWSMTVVSAARKFKLVQKLGNASSKTFECITIHIIGPHREEDEAQFTSATFRETFNFLPEFAKISLHFIGPDIEKLDVKIKNIDKITSTYNGKISYNVY